MKARFIVLSILTAVILSPAAALVGDANDIVEIRLRGRYYAEPATVRITVAVEPDAENRTLRVEADGDQMYRSSEFTLNGENARRIHTLEFKNLPAGEYTLSAQVYSSTALRGMATQQLTVSGNGMR